MTCLISCLNNLATLCLTLWLLTSTAWAQQTPDTPPLDESKVEVRVAVPQADKSAPLMATTAVVTWSVTAGGGKGDLNYVFSLSRNGAAAQVVQTGKAARWTWKPQQAGDYRVQVSVNDTHGNQAASDWSSAFRIEPILNIDAPSANQTSPQAAKTISIDWSAQASGGVGDKTYRFELWRNGDASQVVQTGPTSAWTWQPQQAGDYRLRVTVSDALGNQASSDWSQLFHIEPPLTITSLAADVPAPQAAQSAAIPWTIAAEGGVGAKTYRFELSSNGEAMQTMQSGSPATWAWRPETAGDYWLRVTVSDSLGNQVSLRSPESFRIEPPLQVEIPTADRQTPQAAQTQPIIWTSQASGGVGAKTLDFELASAGSQGWQVQSGPEASWAWYPSVAGDYRVRAIAVDSLGNRKESAWSEEFRIEPPLSVDLPRPGIPGPQMLGTITTPWNIEASGGVGELNYEFSWRRNGLAASIIPSGVMPSWVWTPAEPGEYQVQVKVSDSLGNQVTSPWSEPYLVAPPLAIDTPRTRTKFPQAAQTIEIPWSVQASGGVEPRRYEFELSRSGEETPKTFQSDTPAWDWQPDSEGDYRLRVIAIDAVGNRKESDWSDSVRIEPPLHIESLATDLASPQTARTVPIIWKALGSGGVGELRYAFELAHNDAPPRIIQSGKETSWTWQPQEEGDYRVRVTISDALANQLQSDWSESFRIEPPLNIAALNVDHTAPQAAQTVPIVWDVAASGGVGELTYAFELARNDEEPSQEQVGATANWTWQPENEGNYRVRVTISDALGNQLPSAWSKPFRIEPPLVIEIPEPSNPAEQYLIQSKIDWSVKASGGVGKKTYTFILEQKDAETQTVQETISSSWLWRPEGSGLFRLRALVTDALGNQKQSPWTGWKEIVLPLSFGSLTPDHSAPQAALQQTIRWSAATSGGLGTVAYEFRTMKNGREMLEQSGSESEWDWSPRKPGKYRIKVIARDAENHSVESDWSAEFQITPAIDRETVIAVLPVENLSSVKAPLREIGQLMAESLERRGYRLLPQDVLDNFMKTHRMRYTGGISSELALALAEETGAEAVFITSLESFQESKPPKLALTCRVVLTGQTPQIVWMDSIGSSGDDTPGLLSLGRIADSGKLTANVVQDLLNLLDNYVAGQPDRRIDARRKLAPREDFRAEDFDPNDHYSVAVVPFLNKYARKNAGFIVPLHFVRLLNQYENIRVIEPGLVREQLLKYRLIMPAGPSLAVSDVLASPTYLAADLVLSGHVFDYQDLWGTAKVDFSTQIFDGQQREVIWWSRSSATGDDGVLFFDVGRILSAHNLLEGMAANITDQLLDDNR